MLSQSLSCGSSICTKATWFTTVLQLDSRQTHSHSAEAVLQIAGIL